MPKPTYGKIKHVYLPLTQEELSSWIDSDGPCAMQGESVLQGLLLWPVVRGNSSDIVAVE